MRQRLATVSAFTGELGIPTFAGRPGPARRRRHGVRPLDDRQLREVPVGWVRAHLQRRRDGARGLATRARSRRAVITRRAALQRERGEEERERNRGPHEAAFGQAASGGRHGSSFGFSPRLDRLSWLFTTAVAAAPAPPQPEADERERRAARPEESRSGVLAVVEHVQPPPST